MGGTTSFAYGINNQGQIVGESYTNSSGLSDLGFMYDSGLMTPLGSLGGFPAIQALALNDNRQIVGVAGGINTGGPTVTRGFLYAGGVMTDLGNLGGFLTNVQPNVINNQGQIVGIISGYQEPIHGFLYSGGTMSDLNDLIESGSGWTLSQAWGINDNGQIVGFGQSPSLQTHAFLLTPRPSLQNLRFIGGQAQFDLLGMTGVTYRVEYSLSLPATNWLALSNVVLPSSPTPIVDTSLSPATQRFYRAVQP